MSISGTATADESTVAGHYDALDRFYREIWGEHVHHGLWSTGRESPAQATRAMIDLVAEAARLPPQARVIDVGCGYGGTSRVLAAEHGCDVTGFTLSAAQAAWARAQGGTPRFEVRSWLENELPDGEADAVVAIESLSHMVDKPLAFSQAARVLKAGGRFVLVDWFASEAPNAAERRLLLAPIAREGRLPTLCSVSEYERMLGRAGFRVERTQDFRPLAPHRTWGIVARRLARRLATDAQARRFLLGPENPDRAFALSLARIPLALRTGTLRLVMIAAERS
ncbi:MAG: Methyltransferase type 11 [Solirubrobacterales bacterium]|nr:Methyltransferase type 11 [Solirubrobacterales bacterium]